jgi:MOSC domain-containing protein YiiM
VAAAGSVEQVPARIAAVNVVKALLPDLRGDLDETAIDKRPVAERVAVRDPGPAGVGLAGDQVVDIRHHGGRDQAVYAYAVEDRDWWAAELGRELAPGSFGQNLDTEGIDVTGAVIGERWQVGNDGLVLEVTSPRIPCKTFQGFMDEPQWIKRFTERGACGAYLRVVSPGTVGAGDAVTVIDRPAHSVTVGDAFRPRSVDADRLQRLLDEQPDLASLLDHAVRRDLAARAR